MGDGVDKWGAGIEGRVPHASATVEVVEVVAKEERESGRAAEGGEEAEVAEVVGAAEKGGGRWRRRSRSEGRWWWRPTCRLQAKPPAVVMAARVAATTGGWPERALCKENSHSQAVRHRTYVKAPTGATHTHTRTTERGGATRSG